MKNLPKSELALFVIAVFFFAVSLFYGSAIQAIQMVDGGVFLMATAIFLRIARK